MDTFGLTKKKLLSLTHETRQRHIINWLSRFYQKLASNRVNRDSLKLFSNQYNQILDWTGLPQFTAPDTTATRIWLEKISDSIHYHRCSTDIALKDHDLLRTVHLRTVHLRTVHLRTVHTKDQKQPLNKQNLNCHAALDGLRSIFNVGSIFRTCEAAGFESVILGNTPGKEHQSVRKTAMGAHEWIKQEKTEDLAHTLMGKKEKGFHIIGVETIEGAAPFNEIPWKKNTIVVFGNEEYGISSHVLAVCDQFVYIPMFGRKNSLNVANAAAVICFQAANSIK